MSMHYMHCRIGHPATVRELTRDCANAELADNSSHSEDSENDGNEIIEHYNSDGEKGEADEDEAEDEDEWDGEQFNDHDSEHGEMEMEEEEEDDNDHLSF